ncbi:MAG TPA: CHAD domain-containing protein [Pusillimonas sp.]|uniref:CHAD domain-containing protein n=1 Tax=Pusillimonas sp. TaxID=3040095 RepID=UPI002BCC7792|nr:CHAD domain-containing protein [Pusillimonas sp.]HUH87102.1 CHAD domain-containing protein [Pusillimonas sp.]
MANSISRSYCLPIDAVNDFVTLPIGGLDPMPANEARTDSTAFVALDTFDQTLRGSNRLLLETPAALELLDDKLPLVSQASTNKTRFATEFADGPVKRALGKTSPLRSLLAIGTGERHRATAVFIDDEGKTHCRANLMQLVTSQDRAVIVELHGIKGYEESLGLLHEHIQSLGGAPLQCSELYKQLFPPRPTYDPKPEIPIEEDDTAFDAANKIIATHIPLMRANEFGIIADYDTEFLHDYRIHLRKIRSVLSLFKGVYDEDQTTALKAEFSAFMAPTGALRDLDVYLLEQQRYYDLLPDSLHGGLDALFSLLAKVRATEKNRLTRHLQSTPYTRAVTAAAKRFSRRGGVRPGVNAMLAAHDYATERIWQRYRRVRKIAGGITPATPDAQIHELRIHCKKLRYLMEFFGPVFPQAELSPLLKALKSIQDELGLFNDYSVQQDNLSLFASRLGTQHLDADLEIAQSVGALIAVLHRRQIEQRARVLKQLNRFNRPGIRHAFQQLFQPPKPQQPPQDDDT